MVCAGGGHVTKSVCFGQAHSTPTSNGLAVEVATTIDALQALEADYYRLLRATGNSLPFALHEWHVVCCNQFLEFSKLVSTRPMFHIVRNSSGECVAIAPLILTRRTVELPRARGNFARTASRERSGCRQGGARTVLYAACASRRVTKRGNTRKPFHHRPIAAFSARGLRSIVDPRRCCRTANRFRNRRKSVFVLLWIRLALVQIQRHDDHLGGDHEVRNRASHKYNQFVGHQGYLEDPLGPAGDRLEAGGTIAPSPPSRLAWASYQRAKSGRPMPPWISKFLRLRARAWGLK